MTTITPTDTAVQTPFDDAGFDEAELAVASFLARYSGRTLEAYRQDLRGFFQAPLLTADAVFDGVPGLILHRQPHRRSDWDVIRGRPAGPWRCGTIRAVSQADIAEWSGAHLSLRATDHPCNSTFVTRPTQICVRVGWRSTSERSGT